MCTEMNGLSEYNGYKQDKKQHHVLLLFSEIFDESQTLVFNFFLIKM